MMGMVFDLQRFSIQDGPGIRTTVFLKGCPLHCLWCHNPESLSRRPELSFTPAKCIGCGNCFRICPEGVHVMTDGQHELNRESCGVCGGCVAECYAQALEMIGREMSVDEVFDVVLRDRPFYVSSGGGLTLSGGEPMAQFDFTHALLRRARAEELHTCIETSGFTTEANLLQLAPLVDLFLWDYKETDPARHEAHTGVPLERILSNLAAIDGAGARTVLRCPLIPEYNDREDHFEGIARTASGLTNVQEIQIEPYHPMGQSKSITLGKTVPLDSMPIVDDQVVESWIAAVRAKTSVPVRRV